MERGGPRSQQRGARAAWNAWADLAAERSEAARRLLSAASVFRSDGVRKAFNSWLDVSADRAVMYRALAIFTKRSLSAGFATRDYPSDEDRSKFVRKAGPHANSSSPFHKPLAASATDDQWRQVLKAIRESVTDTTFLHEQPSPRPLRPNDDNYEVRNENLVCIRILLVRLYSHFGTSYVR